ncbi:MAG: GNAT family N-acetyltransferase [Solirubrobacterales bacterium]|nr:GNAT family N-acetyltransferase [Solirubrobacterales bacterium]
MQDAELLQALAANTAFLRGVGVASPGARLIERDGLLATVVPTCPQRSIVNSVIYHEPAALAPAYDELEATYAAAGVQAWTVWASPADTEVTALLAARGHVLDAAPQMMGMGLDELPAARPNGPADWDRAIEPSVLGAINDEAYGYGRSLRDAFAHFPLGAAHWYVARLEGEPVTCLMALDQGTDTDIDMVATRPQARGRGLVTELLAHALFDARERGMRSTTLVASKLGRPVYERLGYRALGPIELWERRG